MNKNFHQVNSSYFYFIRQTPRNMKNKLLLPFFAFFISTSIFSQNSSQYVPAIGYANSNPINNIQATPFDSSNLPIVYISTNWQLIPDEPKITADMAIIDHGYNVMNHVTDAPTNYNGKIGIERRGSISQLWPQKSYSIETRDTLGNPRNASILGMPFDNDWVLYGPYDDHTFMRNVMTYELDREMGYWAPRTKYVEVVINTFGWPVYQGIYVMMEKIKQGNNRVNISKLDSTENSGDDLTGGYIFAIDRNIWAGDSGFVSSNPQGLFFAYKSPSSDKITPQQMLYLKTFVDTFENSLAAPNFADLNNGFRKYAEENSFMDFFFITEMSKNIDAYKRSAYLYKDKYSKGGELHCGPVWDYNSAWYNVHFCGFDVDTGWAYPLTCWVSNAPVPFWWARMLQDTIYTRDQKCRWITWRSSVLDTANIFHIIDSIANYIRPATVRQYAEYTYSGSFQGEVDTLKIWIRGRLNWMDANMPGNCWNLGVANESPTENLFTVFPNPFNENVNVNFNLPSEEKISIELYDVYGKKLEMINQKNYSSGNNQVNISLANYPDGVYFIHIITENGTVAKKVLKMN
jgi:hypothetical protein